MTKRTRKLATKNQYLKFFAMLHKAALNLGLNTPQEIDNYRHRVMREEAGCESVKSLDRMNGFDACIARFATDAGDYLGAIEVGLMETKRRAYVVKVMAIQIMQLKGCAELDARNYLEGIINQARVPCGVCLTDNSFWMDVSPASLRHLVQILDTYRRKLIKNKFPSSPVKFDDTVRYMVDGPIATCVHDIPRNYYAIQPFKVNVRGA